MGKPSSQAATPKFKPPEKAHYADLSSYPVSDEANGLVDHLSDLIAQYELGTGRKNRRRKNAVKLRNAVGALVADLLFAEGAMQAEGWVYRSLKRESFTGGPVGDRTFRSTRNGLVGLGLLNHELGQPVWTESFNGPEAPPIRLQGRASHFKATHALLDKASHVGITPATAKAHFKQGLPHYPLVLKAASKRHNNEKFAGRTMDLPRTAQADMLEAEVRQINEFLDGFEIRGGTHRGFRRIFNLGDLPGFAWNKGGRLYGVPGIEGDTYQSLSKAERLKMTIGGEPVAEIDIRASYLTVLHGLLKKEYAEASATNMDALGLRTFDPARDPYELPGFDRVAVKLWTVATLGNDKHITRWPSGMNEKFAEEHGRSLGRVHSVRSIRAAMEKRHPVFTHWGHIPVSWADLMFTESKAVIQTMTELMRDHRIPSLPVHDSLIVRERDVSIAEAFLKRNYHAVVGIEPALKVSRRGDSEMSTMTHPLHPSQSHQGA